MVILDDVITAGTSVRESVDIIHAYQATAVGVLIALDRQETGQDNRSAIQEVEENFAMPVISIISLMDIIDYLTLTAETEQVAKIKGYQQRYDIVVA